MTDYYQKYLKYKKKYFSSKKEVFNIQTGGGITWRQLLEKWINKKKYEIYPTDLDYSFAIKFYPFTGNDLDSVVKYEIFREDGLATKQNYSSFEDKLNQLCRFESKYKKSDVISFKNLSGDSTLIVPCPDANKNYAHLSLFNKNATNSKKLELWKKVAEEINNIIENNKEQEIYLNTHGYDVPYLHIRIDPTPKYGYQFLNNTNNQLGGSSTKSIIILDGTSSSGKSTIVKYLDSKKKYKGIGVEYVDYKLKNKINEKYSDYLKNIQNKYATISLGKINKQFWASEMIDEGLKSGKKRIIIDTVDPQFYIDEINRRRLNDELYIILLYTGINDLARNIESRRIEGDSRGIFVFREFTERYTKTNKDGIDTVNRKKFNRILLDNFKYYFKNKEELDKFSINIFEKMGINDDNDHSIKVKDEIKYDYLLNTVGKSQEEIFKEVESIFDKSGGSSTKSLTRPSPSESATLFPEGAEKKGNGVNRRVKLNGMQKKETPKFVEFKPKSKKDKDYNLSSNEYLQNSIHPNDARLILSKNKILKTVYDKIFPKLISNKINCYIVPVPLIGGSYMYDFYESYLEYFYGESLESIKLIQNIFLIVYLEEDSKTINKNKNIIINYSLSIEKQQFCYDIFSKYLPLNYRWDGNEKSNMIIQYEVFNKPAKKLKIKFKPDYPYAFLNLELDLKNKESNFSKNHPYFSNELKSIRNLEKKYKFVQWDYFGIQFFGITDVDELTRIVKKIFDKIDFITDSNGKKFKIKKANLSIQKDGNSKENTIYSKK